MKEILISTILMLTLATVPVYAQEEKEGEEVQIQIQEDQTAPDENVDTQTQDENPSDEAKDSTTLSDELQVTQEGNITFFTILFATLTPALLIVVAYLLIKMSNK
jgi:uncharacterized protein YdeI (BOF family)